MASRYERTVAAGTPMLGGVSEESFGAGVGRSLVYAGEQVDQAREKEKRRREDDEVAAFNVEFAKAREEEERAAIDARTASAPGGVGHSDAVAKRWEARRQQLLEAVSSERVRNYASERLAAWGSEFSTREYAWQQGKQVEKLGSDTEAAIGVAANRARRATDPKALGEELDEIELAIEQLSVGDDIKDKLGREARDRIVRSYVEGLNGRDPRQAQSLLESGVFDEDLRPETLDLLRSEAGVEIRREEAEARAKEAAAKAQAREDLAVLQKKLSDNVPMADSDLVAAQKRAAQYGLDGDVYDIGVARVRNNANRIFRSATPLQIDAEVKRLDAEIAKAGDKAKPETVILRDHLADMLGKRTAELKADPLSFGARGLGIAVQPIDWNDPASLDRRVSAARAVAQATGAPLRMFTDEEADLLSAQVAAGGNGRRGVAEQLGRLGARNAMIAARQIAPEDEVLQRAVTLAPKVRALALAGPDYLDKNKDLVPREDSLEAYQAVLGRSIRHLGGEFDAATLETARNIYAGFAGRNGYAGKFREDWFESSIQMALGATKRDGKWQGGIGQWNRAPVLLPTDMTQADFDAALSKINGPLKGASNGTPVWGDGSPLLGSRIRGDFTPVAVRDGIYRFERGGEVLGKQGGGVWLLDVRKLRR